MRKITESLRRGERGSSVADLQDALRHGLDRSALLAATPDTRDMTSAFEGRSPCRTSWRNALPAKARLGSAASSATSGEV